MQTPLKSNASRNPELVILLCALVVKTPDADKSFEINGLGLLVVFLIYFYLYYSNSPHPPMNLDPIVLGILHTWNKEIVSIVKHLHSS